MSILKCEGCGGIAIRARGVIKDTVGAKCMDCGLSHIVTVTTWSKEDVEKLMKQLFVDWPDQVA
jgi:uncharacterized Zn finger protein